jgi:hypothetical protein
MDFIYLLAVGALVLAMLGLVQVCAKLGRSA